MKTINIESIVGFENRYLIYNRKSTDDAENQRNSLIYQRQRNIEYAHFSTLPLASTLTIPGFCTDGVIDESHSAFKQNDEFIINPDGSIQYRILRPKFFQLTALLKENRVKGVIFLCWDRASRNEQDGLIIKKLIKLGCDIRFVEATYDKTSGGELHRDIDGVFAAYTSRNISEKVRNAQRKLRAERRCIYAAPIGYLDRGSDAKPLDPERAPLVRRIFELYATGEWSIRQLAKWASDQGLTKKPIRRKRTGEEIAHNIEVSSIPKIARPVDHKTIEYMLPNPFYIGKVKIDDHYEESNAHQALIDTALFHKVQGTLKKKRVSVFYVDRPFHTYRGLVRCECGRSYSPYPQKGIIYYRSRCKDGCDNGDPNLNESEITKRIQQLLDKVYLTDEELAEIESRAKVELAQISERRDKALADLQAKQRTVMADVDYIIQNKITLLRTGSMDAETITDEQKRLETKLAAVSEDIKIYAASAPEMLKYIITFSELVKNAGLYFKYALDSEKRDIATAVFTELVFKDRVLVQYKANEGFDALLRRDEVSGSAVYLFSELHTIYPAVRISIDRMSHLAFLSEKSSVRL